MIEKTKENKTLETMMLVQPPSFTSEEMEVENKVLNRSELQPRILVT